LYVWRARAQGEIFAAEGYGKVTGEVGVCIATSGPGATNLVTGLADALLDSVPMVAITGQVPGSPCSLCHACTVIVSSAMRRMPNHACMQACMAATLHRLVAWRRWCA
jgi:glyoxylate carboligase